jgi:hypothetical protein
MKSFDSSNNSARSKSIKNGFEELMKSPKVAKQSAPMHSK